MIDQNVMSTRRWADFYRSRGYQPLPSATDAKKPLCRYSDLWEHDAPGDLFLRWPTSNIQVMTGRHWKLLVVDLDGPEAIEHWKTLGTCPPTWITHSGGGGHHVWFSIARDGPPIRRSFIWKGTGPHSGIERLCDHSIVMAPPSIHPMANGRRYQFLGIANSPKRIPLPAPCPTWVLKLKPLETFSIPQARRSIPVDTYTLPGDPVALAKSWGLRIAGRPNAKGWVPCHAIDREDRKPSAAIHVKSGYYVDHGSGSRMSFRELSSMLGH